MPEDKDLEIEKNVRKRFRVKQIKKYEELSKEEGFSIPRVIVFGVFALGIIYGATNFAIEEDFISKICFFIGSVASGTVVGITLKDMIESIIKKVILESKIESLKSEQNLEDKIEEEKVKVYGNRH